jgi:hypothetical protein
MLAQLCLSLLSSCALAVQQKHRASYAKQFPESPGACTSWESGSASPALPHTPYPLLQNYYLVDDKGCEKLMVMAEDSARLDRWGRQQQQQQQQHQSLAALCLAVQEPVLPSVKVPLALSCSCTSLKRCWLA